MSSLVAIAAGTLRPLRRVLSPPVCPACAVPLLDYDRLCRSCEVSLQSLQGRNCSICALPMEGGELSDHRCWECLNSPPAFARVTPAWLFAGAVEQAIHAAKFGKCPQGMLHLAKISKAIFVACVERFRPDFVLPVPIPFLRRLRRGYNQSTLLVDAWSREAGIHLPELNGLKRKWSPPQARQDRSARLKALQRTMAYRGPTLKGKRILAVDDVLTTGSTAEVLSQTLKGAGAQAVEFMVLARVPKKFNKC